MHGAGAAPQALVRSLSNEVQDGGRGLPRASAAGHWDAVSRGVSRFRHRSVTPWSTWISWWKRRRISAARLVLAKHIEVLTRSSLYAVDLRFRWCTRST
jgi:hypothetical protein